jgi:hypothetical protein
VSLLELLRGGNRAGYRYLVLTVTTKHVTARLSFTPPPQHTPPTGSAGPN